MSFWNKVLDTVKDVAPTLAGAAAGAVGGLGAAAVVSSLARAALGDKAPDSDEALPELLLADPEALMRFRTMMRQAELDELKIRTLDTQDAREQHKGSLGPVIVSVLVVIAFGLTLYALITGELPAGGVQVVLILVGTLAAGFSQVLNYWLGSSVGSKEKDRTLAAFSVTQRGKI